MAYQQRGARREDLVGGLALSIATNYLNRLVRERTVGDVIFFQGGTAYNDSVAAAFSQILGKEIIVPPYNGVIGALGMALLARERTQRTGEPTTFRGWNLGEVDYTVVDFVCKACSNECDVRQFTIEGEKTYWGDKCSDRYRKRKKIDRVPVVEDLYQTYESLLLDTYAENGSRGIVVGIPRAIYTYDRLPFFNTWLTGCGFRTVLSDPTNTEIANGGLDAVVAEPCYPIIVAHGHVDSLLKRGVDRVFLPNIIDAEQPPEDDRTNNFVCVWGSTLPLVVGHAPAFACHRDRFLSPTIHFRDGIELVKRELHEAVAPLGVSRARSDAAVEKAVQAQKSFRRSIVEAGTRALQTIRESGEKAIILVGRPYNVFDRTINLSVATKLASIYGINVLPMHFLDNEGVDISGVNRNMYWNYGRKILQTAVRFAREPQFDLIYITNFKCGPDSFIKRYVRDALGRPFLVLQFDGHSNDAGMMTRCEAYLDSKGFLAVRGEANRGKI
jgi:predicted nucleotide-binding protein (sugar kinase/HSP70/actin superfamily)